MADAEDADELCAHTRLLKHLAHRTRWDVLTLVHDGVRLRV